VIYWSLAAVTFLFLVAKRRRNLYLRILISFVLSMIVAFVFTGLLSTIRLFIKIAGDYTVPGEPWLNNAIRGSVFFWIVTALSITVLLVVARKKLNPNWY
jgi:hypothetical protein